MTISADGGWLLATFFLALLGIGVLAYRKRWPSRKRRLVVVGGSSAVVQKMTGSTVKKRKFTFPFRTIVTWVIGIAVALLIIFFAIPFFGWAVDTILHDVLGTKIVYPPATRERVIVLPKVRISRTYSLSLDDGIMPDWIQVPSGYKAVYALQNAPTGATIGMQCSSALDKPPLTAGGTKYWCDVPNTIGRWFRPYIYEHAQKSVVFQYHFERL